MLKKLGKLLAFLVYLPRFSLQWNRAMKAVKRRDWDQVLVNLTEIHERGFATTDSRLWTGCAWVAKNRWVEAEAEFSQIRGSASKLEWEVSRLHNHAVTLARLSRRSEAVQVLRASRATWPRAGAPQLAALLLRLEDEDAHID